MKIPPRAGKQSSALILTLVLITLITLLLVGFMAGLGTEVSSSTSHLSRVQADLYAQIGSDTAVAQLTTTLTATTNVWITQPGRLFWWPTNNPALATNVDLSSGGATETASPDVAANLNPRTYYSEAGGTSYLIDSPDAQPMRADWIYIYKDGTFTTVVPTGLTPQPVVGRFAYWVDDESAKINLNTAWTRGSQNTNAPGDPSQVELSGILNLTGTDANLVQSGRSVNAYNSLLDAARAGGGMTNALEEDAFAFTPYNHSPDLNMFGRPRLVLTTQQSLAGTGNTNFLDILTTPNIDPGLAANLSPTKVQNVVNTIYGYLTNSAWPIAPGKSFAQKYSPSNTTRAVQLAVDIVEYVRCKESTNLIVEPIRGYANTTGFNYSTSDFSSKIILGNTRRPNITAITTLWNPVDAAGHNSFNFTIQLALSRHSGIGTLNLNTVSFGIQAGPGSNAQTPEGPWHIFSDYAITSTDMNHMVLTNGTSATLLRKGYLLNSDDEVDPANYPNPGTLSSRDYLYNSSSGARFNLSPAVNGNTPSLNCPTDGTTLSVDDPANNVRAASWVANAPSTLGQTPSGSYTPQQDTDANGNITDDGMVFPVPKGYPANPYDSESVANPNGIVQSVGELGYVHTGVECTDGTTSMGAPWRTLRLQPEKSGSTDLPDWALLDLFSAPSVNTGNIAFTRPNPQSWGGKINVNSQIVPFANSTGTPLLIRTVPLQSLLLNAPFVFNGTNATVSSSAAGTAATNIASFTLAATGRSYGTGLMTNLYFSPAQIAEIAGISDTGESSEGVLRSVLNQATVRGNVFSIYTVGEALKQDKSGTIHVLSERRFQNIVERYDSGTNIIFQPVFSQSLNP